MGNWGEKYSLLSLLNVENGKNDSRSTNVNNSLRNIIMA